MFLKKYKHLTEMKPYFKKQLLIIIPLIIVMITASTMGMVLAYLMSEQLIAISNILTEKMVKFTILILAAVLIHHICWYLWEKLAVILSNKVALNIKNDIINKLISSDYLYIRKNTLGYYLERLNDDVYGVSNFLSSVYGTLVDVLTNISFLVLIYFLNWQCGLFFTIGILLLLIIDLIKVKKDLINLQAVKETTEKSSSKFTELIRGIKDIKGLGIKQEIQLANEKINDRLSRQSIKKSQTFAFLSRVKTFAQYVIDAVLIFICAFWLFPSGQIEVVVLLIILNYKSLMYDTIEFFSQIKSFYVQGDYKAKRILEILNNTEIEHFGENELNLKQANIKINNLSFSYNNKILLDNISLTIPKNSCSVLIGSSGSGKSTLFNIISKLIQVENNKVLFENYDINNISEKSFKNLVSIVNQDTFLFNDSIENNLKIVKPDATKNEIISACKQANIHSEIMDFPYKYNTVLTENAANLSGGQRQRLAIARAILKNTPIILFDEPTGGLDKENSIIFFNVLKILKQNKTILVIEHKLNNYDLFDNIYELKNAKINQYNADK